MEYNKGQRVIVSRTASGVRKGHPAANWIETATSVTLLESCQSGTVDVVNVRLDNGTEESVYGFNVDRVATVELAKIEDIQSFAERIKGWGSLCELFAGTPKACEAETMVAQTIHACVLNHKEHGEAFSWKGDGIESGRQQDGTDNGIAYRMLLKQGYFVEEEREGKTIIVVTQKLVDFLTGFFARPKGT